MKNYLMKINHLLPTTLLIIAFLFSSTSQAGSFERLFVPQPDLWAIWQQSDESSTLSIDHQAWNNFLQKNIQISDDGINRIHYEKVPALDKNILKNYVTYLEQIKINRYKKSQQLAYWINLYNAVTVKVILEHYPVTTIQDILISPGIFSIGPWGKKLLTINDQQVSLNDIEHRILRPIWKDPRIHYGLNCASIGCPNLLNQAYTAETIEVELDKAAREYVNHPRGVRIEDNELHVSSIYSWFQEDFGEGELGVIKHIKKYAKNDLREKLKHITEIENDHYDWLLNDSHPYIPPEDESY